MIYKFIDEYGLDFEVEQSTHKTVYLTSYNNDQSIVIELSKSKLFDLIGALHSVKTKIEKH